MKFFLVVLLGLFAITTSTATKSDFDLFEGIPEVSLIEVTEFAPQGFAISIPEKVNEAIQKALAEFNALLQKFKDQSLVNREKINKIAQELKAKAEASIKEAKDKIQELVKKGGRVGKCAITYNEELVNISNGIIDGLKECSNDIVLALKELTAAILGYSDEFITSVNNLKDLVMQCYNEESKTAVAKCVATNITKFTKLFGELLTSTKAAINGIYEKSKDLVTAAKSCNDNHIQTTLIKIKDVKSKIDECVKME